MKRVLLTIALLSFALPAMAQQAQDPAKLLAIVTQQRDRIAADALTQSALAAAEIQRLQKELAAANAATQPATQPPAPIQPGQ